MNLTPIRRIEDATSFKIHYIDISDSDKIEIREFKSAKSLSQWVERNSGDFKFLEVNRFALIRGIWEPFTTIGKTTITLHSLKCLVKQLESEARKSSK